MHPYIITDDTDASLMFTIPLFQFPKNHVCHGLGIWRRFIDKRFDLRQALCIDFQHIAGSSRDPVAEFNVREAFDIRFKPLVFPVFTVASMMQETGRPTFGNRCPAYIFMTPNDSSRLTLSVTDGAERLIFLPSSRIDKRLSFFNSAMILKSRSSIFICNFIPSILFHYFNIFTKILSFEIHISLLLIYDYEEVIII